MVGPGPGRPRKPRRAGRPPRRPAVTPSPVGRVGRRGARNLSAGPAPPPRIAFLRAITVEGFRGIGPKATLDLTPGPGLTLVVGRNGSGKSSFAEALELLLTGETYRWENRSKVWKDGWRNLHHPKAAVAAEFALEGEKGTCTVAREWQDGPDLDAATTWAQVHGKPRTGKDALGWDTPLTAYRPFLSYNELGSMLDEGPSKLYDALSKVLGLDALVDAQSALQQARTTRDSAQKDADKERKALLVQLGTISDERAQRATAALARKDWGIDEIEALLAGSQGVRERDSGLEVLQRLAVLPVPDETAIAASVKALREAAERQAQAAQTMAGKSDDLASLLDHAIRFHQAHGDGDCPVCGRKDALHKDWHQQKAQEAESPEADRKGSERSPASHQGQGQRSPKAPGPRPGTPQEGPRGRPGRPGRRGPESFRARVPARARGIRSVRSRSGHGHRERLSPVGHPP